MNTHVAICLFDYFPFGGMQKDALAIARALQAEGARVSVVAKQWEGEQPADLDISVLACRGLTNLARNRDFVRHFAHWRTQRGIDCAVGFQRMPGLDFYYAADSCFAAKAQGKRGALYRLTARSRQLLAYEQAVFGADSRTGILAISEPELAIYRQHYPSCASRSLMLPPGISRDRIRPPDAAAQAATLRAQLGLATEAPLLLLVGSGFRTKGLDRAIEALAAQTPDTRLLVAGQDDARAFRNQARRLGVADRVHFLGGRDDVPRLLLAADLLLHPAYRENTGTVLLEAGVAGLPVIASAVCGYAHYIRAWGYGEVQAEPFDQADFNARVRRMLSADPTAWREAGRRLAEQADIYDMPRRAARHILGLAS